VKNFAKSWAAEAAEIIAKIKQGEVVYFHPKGNSMLPFIKSGQKVKVVQVRPQDLEIDDIVLVKVKRSTYVHFVKGIKNGMFCIGNAKGHLNGWVSAEAIYGKCTPVTSDL